MLWLINQERIWSKNGGIRREKIAGTTDCGAASVGGALWSHDGGNSKVGSRWLRPRRWWAWGWRGWAWRTREATLVTCGSRFASAKVPWPRLRWSWRGRWWWPVGRINAPTLWRAPSATASLPTEWRYFERRNGESSSSNVGLSACSE